MRSKVVVDSASLDTLAPEGLVNGTVIDAYLTQLERRSLNLPTLPQVLVLDTNFYTNLQQQRLSLAQRRFRWINPLTVDVIMAPLHTSGEPGHWSLIVAHPRRKRIESYDSLGRGHRGALYQLFYALKRYALAHEVEFIESAWHLQDTSPRLPHQDNGLDCGVYILWYAERLSRGAEIEGCQVDFDPTRWRRHIRDSILTELMHPQDGVVAEGGATNSERPEEPAMDSEPAATSDPLLASTLAGSDPDLDLAEWDLPDGDASCSPCLSMEVEEDLLEDLLRDALEENGEPRGPTEVLPSPYDATPTSSRDDAQELETDTTSSPLTIPVTFDVSGSVPVEEPTPDLETPGPLTETEPAPVVEAPATEPNPPPRRNRRRREKKKNIFFPGLGWLRVPNRFLHPNTRR